MLSTPSPATQVAPGLARWLATGVILLGSVVLVGWIAGIPVLKSFIPGLIEMKVNTALGFILAGTALALRCDPTPPPGRRWGATACAGLVATLGAATLVEWVCRLDLGIDQLVFTEPSSAVLTSAPGRMAPNTAMNFICDGCALLLIDWQPRRGIRPAQILCMIELLMAILALLVYVYGVNDVFGLLRFTPMAVHTAIGFILLSTGILWSRPQVGPMQLVTSPSSAGTLVRQTLPIALAAPLILAWLCQRAVHQGWCDMPAAFAMFAVATMVCLAIPIWSTAQAVRHAEQTRQEQIRAAEQHAAELLRMNQALRDLQQSKDLLTGMIIHDLRNPLTACLGYLDLAHRRFPMVDPALTRYLDSASQSGIRLLDMINGIIDIIRMEDGKMPTIMAPTDLGTLIDGKLEQYQGAAHQGKIGLTRSSMGASRFVTDPALLGRVLDNLIINAIKHTPPGDRVELDEVVSDGGSAARLTIRDTGEGIAPADLHRLFQKYGRVEGQTMGRTYDTGLGLVFCRMAIDLLHGSIAVESTLGAGTTFVISLNAPGATNANPSPAV